MWGSTAGERKKTLWRQNEREKWKVLEKERAHEKEETQEK